MNPLILHPPLSRSKTELYLDLSALSAICRRLSERGAIVVDESLEETHGALIQKITSYELIPIPAEKTREAKQALEDRLLKNKFDREAPIVAVGGGTITDLAGFTASTYLRGVPLILVPTTLLGMVDAAIGGKTGVDTPFGKNLIGSFYLPIAVLIHTPFLDTLPEREMNNGLAEILKYGLVQDPAIWERCADWRNHLPQLIQASVACKMKIVAADFEEKSGLRRILNFGHTVGHALEKLSDYRMPHGEAVALGCMAESYLSARLGYLPEKTFEEILSLYRKLGYGFKKFNSTLFREALLMDKKTKGGDPRFVMIERIGSCLDFKGEYCRAVPEAEIDRLIAWMHHG